MTIEFLKLGLPYPDEPNLDMTPQGQIDRLRMQNSSVRVLLVQERIKSGSLEKMLPNFTQIDPEDDVTEEDIGSCVKVMRYLRTNRQYIDAPRFHGVTQCVEAAYGSRIILQYISHKEKRNEGLRTGHIVRAHDEYTRNACRIHIPGKKGKIGIPSSAHIHMLEDAALQREEENRKEEESETDEMGERSEEESEGGDKNDDEKTVSKDEEEGEDLGQQKEEGAMYKEEEGVGSWEKEREEKERGRSQEERQEGNGAGTESQEGKGRVTEGKGRETGGKGSERESIDEKSVKYNNENETLKKSVCYCCRTPFPKLHFFYRTMCPRCADLNYARRFQASDLKGKVAIVTGGRVKVGFFTALKFLRCGATVVVTTRFPRHAVLAYASETDFNDWKDRLRLYGPLDLGNSKSVDRFIEYILSNFNELHILVNNAAQTVARPPAYYDVLNRLEASPLTETSRKMLCFLPSRPAEIASESEVRDLIQSGLDWDGEVFDVRTRNSWSYQLDEISTEEMTEVQAVNVIAPFVLCARLRERMAQTQGMKFIINVSAMEGKFYRIYKSTRHPHTNMAKAALNMMTRTSARHYAVKNIFMNSVDPGWVSDMVQKIYYEKANFGLSFIPPIDMEDAAARVCDPIFQALNGNNPVFGLFLKDYTDTEW